MKLYRLAGLICIAVLAVCLVGASAALAAGPTFKPSTKNPFTTSSGVGQLESSSGEKIECKKDTGHGEITGEATVGHVVVVFEECSGKKGTTTCKVKSKGATGSEEIVIATTKGELGTVATTEATSGTGIYFTPESGKVFTTPEGSCITDAATEGSLAGEATPVGSSSTTGKVVFTGAAGNQSIKKITVKGTTSESPSLTAFGIVGVSENTTETVTYEKAVEVS